ncbi:MAG: putative lipid II flippase FtsW [Rhodococcus sp. (in: high G+C Gram-positive bacteria)]
MRETFDTWLARPLHDFQMLVGLTLLLVVFGLMMVLSSSSVESLLSQGSPYARFLPQSLYAVVGLGFLVLIVRLPTSLLRRGAPWLLAVAFVLLALVLVPGIGTEIYGAQSWIFVGSISFQPSEIAKVALVIWSAHMVARATEQRIDVMKILKPLALVSLAVLGMVVLQHDLGTAVTIAVIVLAVLWFGQFPTRIFLAVTGGGVVAMVVFTATAGYRSDRIRAFLNLDADPLGINYQATQAKYALANGGVFGQGLGQSNSKWSYLPQAYNDFIFAIVGEELGAIGALVVIGLYAAVLWVGLRIATRSTDHFMRMLAAVITVWIVFQAFINIGYVIGMFPVTGLQLPLISAGGTSMITTLMMFGLIAHAAYREPEALVSLDSSAVRPVLTRIFGRPGTRKRTTPARAAAGRSRGQRTPDTGRDRPVRRRNSTTDTDRASARRAGRGARTEPRVTGSAGQATDRRRTARRS